MVTVSVFLVLLPALLFIGPMKNFLVCLLVMLVVLVVRVATVVVVANVRIR